MQVADQRYDLLFKRRIPRLDGLMWMEDSLRSLQKESEDCRKKGLAANLGGRWICKNERTLYSGLRFHPYLRTLKMDLVDQKHDDKQSMGCKAMVSCTGCKKGFGGCSQSQKSVNEWRTVFPRIL